MKKRLEQLAQRSASDIAAIITLGVIRVVNQDAQGDPRPKPPPVLLGGDMAAPITADVTSIGRGLHNAIVLLDPTVSREHAVLTHSKGIWWIENASQGNSLWVGERAVPPGEHEPVVPGDVLCLGDTALQLLASTAAYPTEDTDEAVSPLDDQPTRPIAIPPPSSSATGLLNPGVTLQFALSGRRSLRLWWSLVAIALIVFGASAIITLSTAALIGQDALRNGGLRQVLAALAIPLIPAVGVALLVAFIDRYEREPWFVLLATFLWGAIIAIPPVLIIEHAIAASVTANLAGAVGSGSSGIGSVGGIIMHTLLRALTSGATEEAVKGAGLLLLLLALRDEFDNVTDGIIYGFLIGAGFGMVENFVYFALTPRSELPLLILGRVILGWLSHSTFTALFGAGLGYARETRDRRRQRLLPLLGLAGAIGLHTLFDLVVFATNTIAQGNSAAATSRGFVVAALLAAYVPLFVVQALVLWIAFAALGREAGVVREYLADEVLTGTVTPDEYVILQNAKLRARAEHRLLLNYGPRAYLTGRTLNQTAIGLAFRKWHVAFGDPPKRTERQPEEVYRERISRLRHSLQRQLS